MPHLAPTPPDSLPRSAARVFPPLCFLGSILLTGDLTAISLRPLSALGIPYPRLLDFAPLLIPALCAALWLAALRRRPYTGSIASILLCLYLPSLIPPYVDARVARIPIHRFLTDSERDALHTRLPSPTFERSSDRGTELLTAPANAPAARTELQHLGLLPH